MVDETHRLEGAVGLLVLGDPAGRLGQHGVVDEDEVLGLGEGLQHEGGEPEAALLVALPEGGEAAVVAPVGQLTLVAGDHQLLGLGHDLRLELAGLLEVAGMKTSGAKRIMFCSPQPKGIWRSWSSPSMVCVR